jgi:hypothetical protein
MGSREVFSVFATAFLHVSLLATPQLPKPSECGREGTEVGGRHGGRAVAGPNVAIGQHLDLSAALAWPVDA